MEFEQLCGEIRDFVNLSIDNLTHFGSFKRMEELKNEYDRANDIINSLTIVENDLDPMLQVREGFNSVTEVDGFGLLDEDLRIDQEEFDEAKSRGLFKNLSVDESSEKLLETEQEEERKTFVQSKTDESLNKLILKRIDNMKL